MSEEQKQITMNEFRMWLEGVEEMQSADWTPDARQWKRIREKINSVTADEPIRHTAHQQIDPQPIMYNVPPTTYPTQSLMSSVPAMSNIPQGPIARDGLSTVKTPDIDTQGKPYESSFA